MPGIWVDRNFQPVEPWGELVVRDSRNAPHADPHASQVDPPQEAFAWSDGPIPLWQGAQEHGETGLRVFQGVSAVLLWEVSALPDFSAARFPDLTTLEAAQRVGVVAQWQMRFLAWLTAQGPAVGFSLRYLKEKGSEHLRLFQVLRVSAPDPTEVHRSATELTRQVESNAPQGYPLRRCSAEETSNLTGEPTGYCEVGKVEQWEEGWHDPRLTGFRFWYGVQGFVGNASNDMLSFCQTLARLPGSALVDITLVPTSPLTSVEREELQTWQHLADRYSRDRKESVELPGGLYSKPERRPIEIAADPKAEGFKRLYEGLIQSFDYSQERPLLYAIRCVALDQNTDATAIARLLASHTLQPGAPNYYFTAVPGTPEFDKALRSVQLCYITPAICQRYWSLPDAPETLRRLHRLTSVAEIAPFFRLPIPGKDGCVGFARDGGLPGVQTKAGASTGALQIGRFYEAGRESTSVAGITLPDLCKHALIVGVPGSGKTSLSFSLLVQLWSDNRIPWLVLEPAKTEYRGLLEVPGLEDLLVFTVGNERTAPLRLNPLEILDGVAVSEHIAALKACFQGAFSLPDPLPMLFETALEEVYTDKGWSLFGEGGDDPSLEPPTLTELYLKGIAVAERSRYQGETAGNIRAMLETRLGSLLKGPKGRCFAARRSVPIEELMERPVVLELDALSEDEKALTMMVLLVFVRERAITTRRSGAPLSHVCLVEEAHNLLGSSTSPKEGADPKGIAVRYFTRMLAEMRALGEGLIIADQLPTALAPEVVKNTNIKIMHRLTAADDREVLGKTMVLSEGQLEQAAVLPVGMSYVFQEGWPTARLVKEPDIKGELGIAEPPDRGTVKEHMAGFFVSSPAVRDAYLPYLSCRDVCQRCDPLVRERRERWAQQRLVVIEEKVKLQAESEPEAIALIEYSDGLTIPADANVENGCALVHLLELVQPRALQARKKPQ
ncbi:hypothetical protein [Armatimonas sp.]|uniref:ATP-binding protein n=1 Tax=Armatimonas sp. TaxID=1872638 RepID=UPI00286AA76F|nr:hypothetical protein [Armatimonas sp.]